MNSEQLHAVCKELVNEISGHQLIDRLTTLEQALEQAVSQPHVPEYQQQIGEIRNQLKESLAIISIANQSRSVSKKQIVDEIGGSGILGKSLLDRIEHSFTQNEVTLGLVKDDISELKDKLVGFYEGLENLIRGFVRFKIAFDELEPYTAELGILIPRENNENLAFIAKDLKNLNHQLQAFNELVTGRATQFSVRTISSSDFSIFLELLPIVALEVVGVIYLLELAYEKLLDIRLKRMELKKKSAPDPLIQEIDKWAKDIMEKEIDQITKDLIAKYKSINRPDFRDNELEIRIKSSVRDLAGRIDAGYNFSARIGPLLEQDNDEDSDEEFAHKQEVMESISETSKKMEHKKFSGDPILPIDWQPSRKGHDGDDGDKIDGGKA